MTAVPFWDVLQDPQTGEFREPAGYEENEGRVSPWERLILNNALVPGLATVKVTRKFLIDVQKSTDEDGGMTVERGHEAARVDIAILVWTTRQWENLQRLLETIWRRPGQKLVDKDRAKAISIFHPACATWGVSAVLIETGESPEPGQQTGSMTVKLRCIEYIVRNKQKTSRAVAGLKNAAPFLQQVRNVVTAGETPADTEAYAVPPVEPGGGQ